MRTPIYILIFALVLTSCNWNYGSKFKKAYQTSKTLASESAGLSSDINRVWRTAIFDHRYEFGAKSEYVSDFNTALMMLLEEPENKAQKIILDSLEADLKKQITELQDPPGKYKDAYEDMISLYGSVVEYSTMARIPDGNLQSYTQRRNDVETKIVTKMKEMEVRVPSLQKEDSK